MISASNRFAHPPIHSAKSVGKFFGFDYKFVGDIHLPTLQELGGKG
jgi:hypothetical protein